MNAAIRMHPGNRAQDAELLDISRQHQALYRRLDAVIEDEPDDDAQLAAWEAEARVLQQLMHALAHRAFSIQARSVAGLMARVAMLPSHITAPLRNDKAGWDEGDYLIAALVRDLMGGAAGNPAPVQGVS